jgi:hypothetical protein
MKVRYDLLDFRRRMLAAERVYTDIRRWSFMPCGGYFAAMEQPEAFGARVARVLPAAARVRGLS